MTNPEQLARIIRAHRISYADGHGTAKCSCGHHYGKLTDTRRAEHLAQAILNAGWTAPIPDPWCREENCEHRHWRSGPIPTHRRGDDCPPHGYTSHGHPIKGQPQSGKRPPIARCGGPRLCTQCAKETN